MTQSGEENGWVTADEYLSGNVREKLRVAELAAASDPAFTVNTEYLRKAQPKDQMCIRDRDKRLDRLVENDQYLTALEMEEYRKLEQEYGVPLPMPTAAHVFPPTPPERYDTGNEHVDNMLNTAADVYARSELAAPQRFTAVSYTHLDVYKRQGRP